MLHRYFLFLTITAARLLGLPILAADKFQTLGIQTEQQDLGFALKVNIYRSSLVETHVYLDLLGNAYKIESYGLPDFKLLSQENIGHNFRELIMFDENEKEWRRVRYEGHDYLKTKKYVKQVTYSDPNSNKQQTKKFQMGLLNRERGRLNSCSRNLTSLPEIDTVREIISPDSNQSFNLEFNGCNSPNESTLRPQMEASFRAGLECLTDTRRGGSQRGQRDAQILYHNLVNQRFAINCQEILADADGVTFGGASIPCPSDPGNSASDAVDFPGMKLSQSWHRGRSSSTRQLDFQRLAFHEALHSVGHTHGQSPEVTKACERCCFPGDLSAADVRRVCSLCRVTDNAAGTESYLAKYIGSYRELGHGDSDEGGINLAVAEAVAMAAPFISRHPSLIALTAIELFMQTCSSASGDTIVGMDEARITRLIQNCVSKGRNIPELEAVSLLFEIARASGFPGSSPGVFNYAEYVANLLNTTIVPETDSLVIPSTTARANAVAGSYVAKRMSGMGHNGASKFAEDSANWPTLSSAALSVDPINNSLMNSADPTSDTYLGYEIKKKIFLFGQATSNFTFT
jgi:hypothetical protein